eukprot:SAG31_NODE_15884_length_733_cov_1.585174_1_plen_39_part_10
MQTPVKTRIRAPSHMNHYLEGPGARLDMYTALRIYGART